MKSCKLLSLVLALILVLGLFAGCGSSSTATTTSSETAAETTEAAESTAVAETQQAEAASAEATVAESAPAEAAPAEETASATGNAISYPLSDGSATLSIWCTKPGGPPVVRDSWSEVEIFQQAEEILGVKIEWNEVDMTVQDTQLALMIATGDYPDIISGIVNNYSTGAVGAYDDGVIIDISSYVYDNMPNYWNYVHADSEVENYVMTEEGYELAVYVVNDQQLIERGMLVRQDWLDALGLSVPQTYDDLTEVLVAFKNAYNCTEPLCIAESGLGFYSLTSGFDISYMESDLALYVDDNGQLVCSYMTENYKEYLQLVNSWYELGLFDADYLLADTGTSMNDTQTIICNENTGVFYTSGNQLDTYYTYSINSDFDVTAVTCIVQNVGDDTVNHFADYEPIQTGQTVSISTDCEDVELALRWLDYWYSDAGVMSMTYGTEGETYTIGADGTVSYTDLIVNNDQDMSATGYIMKYNCQGKITGVMMQKANWAYYTDKQKEVIDIWSNNVAYDRAIPSYVSMSSEENTAYNNLTSDIITHAETELTKFIFGTRDFSEWDAFVEELKAMGIEDAIAIYQAAYDRQAK